MTYQPVLRWILAAGMIAIGVAHFVTPEPFMRIVPPAFGDAYLLVVLSGVFEVLGGAGLLIPFTRRAAAWGLVALYIAVFPANVYMAIEGIQIFPERPAPEWAAWLRLPFQAVFIGWAWLLTRPPRESDAESAPETPGASDDAAGAGDDAVA